MEAAQAISLTAEWIRSRGLDYPTEGLEADRFEAGWSVFAPVDIDESDPMGFLQMPVGRLMFLVADSGRIEEVPSSIPTQQALDEFTATELGAPPTRGGNDEAEFMAEFERSFRQAASESEGPPEFTDFTIVDTPPANGDSLGGDVATTEEAERLLDPIVQQLALLGPPEWDRFSAEFSFTVSAEVAQLRFWSGDQSGLVPVPKSIAELVRRQREVAAQMPAGPWWRLVLSVSYDGEGDVTYDYGDEPFPDDQLMRPEHYRNDLETYPREHVPIWLAGYAAGPAGQGRDPHRAAAAASEDDAAGRAAVATEDLPPLGDVWARWAALSAAFAGARSEWGPRIYPGYAWYESDQRSGSTLFLLPGDRAVLSGGKWNSPLLEAAYNGGEPLPDLYAGAPFWVNDVALNTRVRNGLLSFCYWWVNGQWYRGATDTSGELDVPIPLVWTPDETVRTMASQTGLGTEEQCEALLTAAANRTASREDVAAMFSNKSDADVDIATNQLSLAGLLTF